MFCSDVCFMRTASFTDDKEVLNQDDKEVLNQDKEVLNQVYKVLNDSNRVCHTISCSGITEGCSLRKGKVVSMSLWSLMEQKEASLLSLKLHLVQEGERQSVDMMG